MSRLNPYGIGTHDMYRPPTIDWSKIPKELQFLQTMQSSTSKTSMSLTRKSQVPTPEWVMKGFKSYADYERHQKLLDATMVGRNGAGVAPWAKEGISYEQWRTKHPATVQSQGGHSFSSSSSSL